MSREADDERPASYMQQYFAQEKQSERLGTKLGTEGICVGHVFCIFCQALHASHSSSGLTRHPASYTQQYFAQEKQSERMGTRLKISYIAEAAGTGCNFERAYVNTEYWSAHINNPMLMTIFVLTIDWLQKLMSYVFNT